MALTPTENLLSHVINGMSILLPEPVRNRLIGQNDKRVELAWSGKGSFLRGLPLSAPLSVGAAFHAHPTLGGVAIEPSSQNGSCRTRCAKFTLWPIGWKRKLDVAVAPSACHGPVVAKGPRSEEHTSELQ